MDLFKDYKNSINEGDKDRESGLAQTLKDMLTSEHFVIYPASEDVTKAAPWVIGSDQPEYKQIQKIIKARIARAEQTSEAEETPLFTDYLSQKNKGLPYLNEDENNAVDDAVQMFETEYDGDISKIDEGFFGKLVGGAAGFLAGPMIGRVIAKALGIEKGILYDMFTSRLVSTALGVAISKAWSDKK